MHPAHSKPHLVRVAGLQASAWVRFGIQFGFALPQANATRIFQNLGASLEAVPLLWLAGPITGLLVQPLVGYYSDRTWTRFGRRRPYFLAGAMLAAMTLDRHAECHDAVDGGAVLWILDASLNLTMGPFRAFVADQMSARAALQRLSHVHVLRERRRRRRQPAALGDGVDSASRRIAPPGEISDAVKYAFYVGATLLISAVCWSAFTTREFPPEVLEKFDGPASRTRCRQVARQDAAPRLRLARARIGRPAAAYLADVRAALYVLVFASLVYGVFLLAASRMRSENAFTTILGELDSMSASMRWLALVQFCSWFTLFTIFVYTTPAVAKTALRIQQSGLAGL